MSQNQSEFQNRVTRREDCIVCHQCPSALQASLDISLDMSVIEILKSTKARRRVYFNDLIKKVNALMNTGGGLVYINCEMSLRHFLDEQIEDELMKLVPDNSLFSDNFERRVLCDSHVAIRVKPRDHGILSTFNFHTKVSLNKGLVDPTHSQIIRHMKKFISSYAVNADEEDENRTREINTPPPFRQGECIAFNENKDSQAKVVYLEDLQMAQGASNGEKLLTYIFDNLKLPHYISAFTKQKNGGSLFIGLREDKRDGQKKWVQVKHMDDLKVVFGTDKMFWKDEKTQLFHVAAYQDVPETNLHRTGKFICEGISLSAQDQDYLKRELMNKMKRTMVWNKLHENHMPDVFLKFHPVQSDSAKNESRTVSGDMELCVIEVVVKFFNGLCFYDDKGPEAYTLTNRENRPTNSIERLSVADWFQSYVRLSQN